MEHTLQTTEAVASPPLSLRVGQLVEVRSEDTDRVTVRAAGTDTTNLVSPVPLDTLYEVKADSGRSVSIDFSSRGFATMGSSKTIKLTRTGVANDSVVITKTGMVQR